MDHEDIEIFLNLVESRNITLTAKNLHLSQSTVSTRLKKLEERLGFQLLERSKGIRTVTLTPQGTRFIPTAEQWMQLFHETFLIQSSSMNILRIATNESTYYELLSPFFLEFYHQHPETRLSIHICTSTDAYELVERKLVHFAFASVETVREHVATSCIYQQEFGIIYSSAAPIAEGTDPSTILAPQMEVRLTGGHFKAVNLWQEQHFQHSHEYLVEIDSVKAALPFFKSIPGAWAFLTRKYAEEFQKEASNIHFLGLNPSPPMRSIFLLKNTVAMRKAPDYVCQFERALYRFLKGI